MTNAEVADALTLAVQDTNTVVCADGHAVYMPLEKRFGVKTRQFVASYHGQVPNGGFHVQNVNNYHARLPGSILCRLGGAVTKCLAWMWRMRWKANGLNLRETIASAMERQAINR